MEKLRKILSVTLTILLLICSLNLNSSALDASSISAQPIIDFSEYKLSNLPEFILEAIESNGKEVLSLENTDIEDLHSITTNNEDGSKTHFTFKTPIKYIKDNKISFIDPIIEKVNLFKQIFSKYKYENTSGELKSFYPEKMNDGILMEYNDYSFEMKPNTSEADILEENAVVLNNNVATYLDVFSSKDYIEYIPTTNGVKENIILEEYTGQNIFEFTINIGNLVPEFMSGESIPLLDKETGEWVMTIGQVDARDSYVGENENNDTHFTLFNSLSLVETEQENEYKLTVTVDKEFLESETTVYPVIIDPTVNITGSSAFEDTTIYSGKPNSNFYSSSYLVVGNHGSSYGEGIGLVQLTSLANYKYINPNIITSVIYHTKEGSGKTNTSNIKAQDVNSTWNHTEVTYNNITLATAVTDTETVTTSKDYSFTITQFFKWWLYNALNDGGWTKEYGFALKATDSTASSKHFYSTNHGSFTPYIEINYSEDTSLSNGVYFIHDKFFGDYLDSVTPESGYTAGRTTDWQYHGDTNQRWRVTKNSDGTYNLSPISRSGFYLEVYNQVDTDTQPVTTYNHSTSSSASKWRIIKNLDNTYRIMPVFSKSRALDVYGSSDTTATYGGRSFPKRYGTDVQIYTYNGFDHQRWIFEKVNFGSSPSYSSIATSSKEFNCGGFALRTLDNVQLYSYNSGYPYEIESCITATISYFNSDQPNRTIRRISGKNNNPTFSINNNEYRVALRVSGEDFHYMIQTNDGKWAHKRGKTPSELIGYINPTAYTWPGGYNSDVVYFAVSY